MLNFRVEHLRRWLREGNLKGEKIGTTWLVLRKSVTHRADSSEEANARWGHR
jgi:hypothetical protein